MTACEHHSAGVLASRGGYPDDHETSYVYCSTCDEFLVIDACGGDDSLSRPMTGDERIRYHADAYRAARLALRVETVDA